MNVITRLRLSNTENGTSGFSAVRSTNRNADEEHHRGDGGADHPRVDPAARRALGEDQHRRRAAERGQQRAGDVELEPFVVGLADPAAPRSR